MEPTKPKRKRSTRITDIDRMSVHQQMRYQFALKRGFLENPEDLDWWEKLTGQQKSIVQGDVTKMLITKAQMDMKEGKFEI